MSKKGLLLFKTLLLSTSSLNILKTSEDKKKKRKIIGSFIGMAVLYLMLIGYCGMMAIGYGAYGLGYKIPSMSAVLICGLSFFFTVFKAGSYLFGFREYDMLMSLPFSEKDIVASKFMYMYMKNLPWNLSIAIAMILGYAVVESPPVYVYPIWLVLSAFLPIIPMLAASLIGFIVARIGARFKQWKVVRTILTFAFVIFCFLFRFIIESVFRKNEVSNVVTSVSEKTDKFGSFYLPVRWFESAITEHNILNMLLLVVTSAVLFEALFVVVSKSYRMINSSMKTGEVGHKYKMHGLKKKSPVMAIAEKELRRLVGSTNYFVNVGFGYIFAVLVGIISLFVGLDKIISVVVQDAPITSETIMPAIPFVIYFFTGMVSMTTCSPSLEGKNYWIIKSSPLTSGQIYLGKIVAGLCLSLPTHLLTTIMFCISARASLPLAIGFLFLGGIMCLFSAVYGCACGIHFIKLDWENEIEVIKQGTAVVAYMFPNMILTTALLFGSIFLSAKVGNAVTIIFSALLYFILSVIFMFRIKKLSSRPIA